MKIEDDVWSDNQSKKYNEISSVKREIVNIVLG
jgi:hypothetical protein